MNTAIPSVALNKITINQTIEFYFRDTPSDHAVIKQIFKNQGYSTKRFRRHADILRRYHKILAAGDQPLVVDCGANIGASAIYFALLFPKAIILAVEPNNDNYALLQKNTKDFKQIHAQHCAVGSHDGVLNLFDPGAGPDAYRTSTSDCSNIGKYIGEVKCRSLKNLISDASAVPFLLKIDIEGAEADLFSKYLEPFTAFYLVIVELHDWLLPGQANSRNFLAWHASSDRDFVYHGENVFSIDNSE